MFTNLLPLKRICGEVIEAVGPPRFIQRCLYYGDGFIAPKRDGRVLLGSNYDTHNHGDDTNRNTISIETAIKTLTSTTQMVDGLEKFQIRRVWKGWRPCTLDMQPVIGFVGSKNLLIATGFFGLGITLAPAAAECVCDLILGNSRADIDELRPDRLLLHDCL